MRPAFLPALSITLLCATLTASADTHTQHKATTTHATTGHAKSTHSSGTHVSRVSSHSSSHAKTTHGKASAVKTASHAPMDTARATQIQTALIKSGYLSGEASGTWDAESTAAMQKMQSDNGWQTKIVPDSRALIKLGLGPTSTPPAPN